MPPRPAKKPGPAGPKRPAARPEKVPQKAQVAGDVGRAGEVAGAVKEPIKEQRVGGGGDVGANGSRSGESKWDAARPITLQFGTINAGLMNGMQIPARTCSAPPNLDEQKKDQARHESFRAVPAMSAPSVPKPQPQQPRKDVGTADRSSVENPKPPSQVKRDVHVPIPSGPVGAPQKPTIVHPPMAPVQATIPFQRQQPQVPLQFGGPSPQMHPQGLAGNPLQMPMSLPVGSAPQLTQQIFIPSHHMLQQPAMMHQGQGLGFVPPGHQLAPQLGSLGVGIVPQFSQQQPNKYGGPRKTTVKITHPDTHEELRLDKRTDAFKDATSSMQRSLPNVAVQSQHVAAAYPPSTQYYAAVQPNSYNTSQLLFPAPHVPLSNSQLPASSQAPRYPHSASQTAQFPQVLNNVAGGKPGPQTMRGVEVVSLGGATVSVPAPNSVQVTVKPPPTSQVEKGRSSVTISMPIKPLKVAADVAVSHQRNNESVAEPVQKAFIPAMVKSSSAGPSMPSTQKTIPEASSLVPNTPAGDSVPILQGNEGNRRESVRRSDSFKDNQKKSIKKDHKHLQQPYQSDAIIFADSAKTSSAKTIKDTKVGDGNLQDAPQVSTDEPNSRIDGVSMKETEKSEASISSEHLINKSIPNKSDASVAQEKVDVHRVERVVDAARNENVEVPKELSQDLADAKAHPVSLNQSSKDANRVTLVEQNDDNLEFCGKADTYDNVGDLELGISRPLVSSTNDKEREVKDCISDKPMALIDADPASSCCASYANSATNENLLDNLKTAHEVSLSEDKAASVSDMASPDSAPESILPHGDQKVEDNDAVLSGGAVHLTSSGPKEKPISEISKPKITAVKKKKKIKEILSKADAAGASDLYNAYKGPEGKPEEVTTSESVPVGEIHVVVDDSTNDVVTCQQDGHSKSELDDWEDAADVSTPRLGAVDHKQPINANHMQQDEDGDGVTSRKKYSRDFLLTFSHQVIGLPQGFQIGSDIVNALLSAPVAKQYVTDFDPYSGPGMIIDRPGASRIDRRNVSYPDDDKWNRSPGSYAAGRDPRLDHGVAVVSLRPGQGANHGVLRNPRTNNFTGGILAGPQTLVPQGGMGRSNYDADRWQKATGQRGLMPSPQGPMQVMHKAEKKYEIGKISDEEEAKQRQLKAILNKLTPQNFDKLFAQVIEVNIDNPVTLTGIISQIFDKALMEPTFCEMYANLCSHLSEEMPDFVEGTEKITFKRLLLNKCQEEFERGEREQAEANRVEEEGEIKQTEEEREEKRIRARRRMLGNIRLIGELYKKKMLTERIMHECIIKLLGQGENHDEEDIEALCKLMSTIGEIIDNHRSKEHMDAYFDQMTMLSTNQKLSPRVRFLLRDTIDLRKNKWRQRIKVEGPKKIDEVHRDAAQERQGQGSRSVRGTVIGSMPRRGPTVEYGLRGPSPFTSPVSQSVAGIRGVPPQIHNYPQDIRFEDKHQFESRSLLPQRSAGHDSITFGPQGGLARGMSNSGQPLMPNVPTAETLGIGDYRRMPSGQNGYNPILNSSSFNSRESRIPERTFDRSASIPPSGRGHAASSSSYISSSQVKMSEDSLREKSMLAIKEFYSSKDEQELVQCVKDLNAPSYYPTMISQWVTDSFERKDKERELLAKLIVNLCNSHDSFFRPGQLIQGFEHVLSFLEDAVTDAPRAVEFLGRIFATAIVENVIPFREVGRLIRVGGEEPGQLLESGLAADVLGSILESIRSDKGDSFLNNIRVSSNLRLEDFRPPDPNRSNKLEAFL